VPEDHRPPRSEEVEVFISIHIKQIGALGMGDERWISPYCAKRPHRRVDASRQEFFSTKLQLTGASKGTGHINSIKRHIIET